MSVEKPIVSIICLAYNHEKFIKNALDGFVMQETNFPFEIIIHDDASTDNTPNIIREYETMYKDLFKPIYQTQNQASQERGRVTRIVFNKVKGKYIALCEGDDYWTDPLKLQKQVDFLESNPGYTMSFHNAKVITDVSKEQWPFNSIKLNKELSLEEVVEWVIPTASIVFKASILPLPAWSKKIYSGDMTLALTAFMKGKIYSMNEIMSVYRQFYNNDSMTARTTNYEYILDQHILLYTYFDQETKGIHKKTINKHIRLIRYRKRYSKFKELYGYAAFLLVPGYTYWRILGKKI